MDKTLTDILGVDGLPKEMLASLQEAFDKKVAGLREDVELDIRKEFASRYEQDKKNLIEAMDLMLTDVVRKHETAKQGEINKLRESKKKLATTIKEAKSFYKTKLSEHLDATDVFIANQLGKNVKQLVEAKSGYNSKATKINESFSTLKNTMRSEQTARLKKIDEFVVKQVSRELTELEEDHRSLIATRAKLLKESAAKMKDLQKRFVAESAKKVEAMTSSMLKKEMTQLHEDIERNRQNNFGRRIFEAIAHEFKNSHYAETAELHKLQAMLESKEAELATTKTKLVESAKVLDVTQRKAKLSEANASRAKIMSELLSNLRGDKKSLMESMLETTKTENLRGAFDRLLPVVLSEGRKPQPVEKKMLSEKQVRLVTGDKATRISEAQIEEEDNFTAEIGSIVRLAGIIK